MRFLVHTELLSVIVSCFPDLRLKQEERGNSECSARPRLTKSAFDKPHELSKASLPHYFLSHGSTSGSVLHSHMAG